MLALLSGRLFTVEVWDTDKPLARTLLTPPGGKQFVPDIPNWTWSEYGMRIGFWRIMEIMKKNGITPNIFPELDGL